ncbi:MAG: DUF4384 domain-containing protein [Gemmatimonadetes bacterium]|nr:DUF4384 domain-containing protein [Gemmatimonadota bacterium]
MMFKTILAALAIAHPPGGAPAPAAGRIDRHGANGAPSVEVWSNEEDVFRRGQQVRVYFRASQDAYVTVFRIDTDGRLRVLFPTEPWEDNYARGGQRYETQSYGDRYAFVVDDYPGQGYLFAVASADPFSYNSLVRGDHWDYREIAASGRVTGDPYVALTDLVDRIVPANYSEYSYDILPYYVEQKYDYPRFLCYDCHTYASFPYWNPYARSCFRFRVVIYDDFYYNPVRYGGRPRFVYTRTTRIAPRYVIQNRAPSEAFVTRVRQRPVDDAGGRVLIDPGIRGRDLGGVGQVPSPIVRRNVPDTRSGSSAGNAAVGPGRRVIGNDNPSAETGRGVTPDQPDRRVVPNEPSGRRPSTDAGEAIRRPSTGDARQLPQLERREPKDESGQSNDAPATRRVPDREVKPQPRADTDRGQARPEVRRQPETTRQVERPREPERQPETRPQPERREQPQAREAPPKAQPQPERRPSEPAKTEGSGRRVEDPN